MSKSAGIPMVTAMVLVIGMTVSSAQVSSQKANESQSPPRTLDDIRKMPGGQQQLPNPYGEEDESSFGAAISGAGYESSMGMDDGGFGGGMEGDAMGEGIISGMGAYGFVRATPRDVALRKVRNLRNKLKSTKNLGKASEELRKALAHYFTLDMQHRVRELDQIKARVVETEAMLQRRLDSQEEAVELQLKLMLREAAGETFFHKD